MVHVLKFQNKICHIDEDMSISKLYLDSEKKERKLNGQFEILFFFAFPKIL